VAAVADVDHRRPPAGCGGAGVLWLATTTVGQGRGAAGKLCSGPKPTTVGGKHGLHTSGGATRKAPATEASGRSRSHSAASRHPTLWAMSTEGLVEGRRAASSSAIHRSREMRSQSS